MKIYTVTILFALLFTYPALALVEEKNTIRLYPALCKQPSAAIVDGSIPKPEAVAKDAYCASQLMKVHAPRGAVTIFGSARTGETEEAYKVAREFARLWTLKNGATYPVLTGGGFGIMEAGNRGASDAKGKSLSIGTVFTSGLEKPNPYITHSYMATSFAQRESDLVDYAAAIVVAPGGFGTEWEIYESLSKMQTRKKNPVPLVLLGGKKSWLTLLQRIDDMKIQKTISPADLDLIFVAESPESAVTAIESTLLKRK